MNVLDNVKKMIGIPVEDDGFDIDLIITINTVLQYLVQMGGDKILSSTIIDVDTKWDELFSVSLEEPEYYDTIKLYIVTKTKTIFDPQTSSILADAYNKNLKELEWRITNIILKNVN